jgi:hypothetical protein
MNSYKQAVEVLKGRKTRKLGNNTYLETRDAETVAVRLHQTDVVTYKANGAVVLNSGGWKTNTTKARINEYSPVGISQEKRVWYVTKYEEGSGWQTLGKFVDGLIIEADGSISNVEPITEAGTKADNKKKRQILKYATAYMEAFADGDVPAPGAGDCFYCGMSEVTTGKPLGEVVKDKAHLDLHIEENYFVPSLLANAMKENSSGLSLVARAFISDKWAGTNNNSDFARDIAMSQIKIHRPRC